MTIALNSELLADPDFKDQVGEHLEYVLGNITAIDGIGNRLLNLSENDAQRINEELTDIELDVWVRIGAPEEDHSIPSSWLVGVSWAAASRPVSKANELTQVVEQVFFASKKENSWANALGDRIRAVVREVARVKNFDGFVVLLMALNHLLLNFLLHTSRMRIERSISGPSSHDRMS